MSNGATGATGPNPSLGFGPPGLQPAPSPWVIYGSYISYGGGVVIGAPVGGNQGPGTINAKSVFINGQPFAATNFLPVAGGTVAGGLTVNGGLTAVGGITSTLSNHNWLFGAASGGAAWSLLDVTNGINYLAANSATKELQVLAASGLNIVGGKGIAYSSLGGTDYVGFTWTSPVLNAIINNAIQYPISTSVSDERLKSDIEPSNFNCLEQINAIPLFKFKWVTLLDRPAVPVGLIAQRLNEIAPYLVQPGNDTKEPYIPSNKLHLWQIDEANLIATLVGGIQELTKRNEELVARIHKLENPE
jgi:hypothetical protein